MTLDRGPFGALIRRYRLAAGLSQEELAARADISRRAVADLERGARRAPYPDTVRRLCEALALGPTERAALSHAARPDDDAHASADVGAPLTLPVSGQPLIGRDRELAAVQRLLARARFV